MAPRIVSIAGFPAGSTDEDIRAVINPHKRNKWPIADIQFDPVKDRVLIMFQNTQHANECIRILNSTGGYLAEWARQVQSSDNPVTHTTRRSVRTTPETPRIVHNLEAQQQTSLKSVFLCGFPKGTLRWEIEQRAAVYGTVLSLRVLADGATAFVDYADEACAYDCIENMFARTGITARWVREKSSSTPPPPRGSKRIPTSSKGDRRCTVYLCNLPPNSNSLTVVDKCSPYGVLKEVRIDRDRAWVEFTDHNSAQDCVDKILHDTGSIVAEWSKNPIQPEPTFKKIQPAPKPPKPPVQPGAAKNKKDTPKPRPFNQPLLTTLDETSRPLQGNIKTPSNFTTDTSESRRPSPLPRSPEPRRPSPLPRSPKPQPTPAGPDYKHLLEEQEKITQKYKTLLDENEKIFLLSKQRWAEERADLLKQLAAAKQGSSAHTAVSAVAAATDDTAWARERAELVARAERAEQAEIQLKVIKTHMGAVDLRFEEVLDLLRSSYLE